VGFEPTIPVFDRAKIFHASDRAATVIGSGGYSSYEMRKNEVRCFDDEAKRKWKYVGLHQTGANMSPKCALRDSGLEINLLLTLKCHIRFYQL
jgi:hypothetical protein